MKDQLLEAALTGHAKDLEEHLKAVRSAPLSWTSSSARGAIGCAAAAGGARSGALGGFQGTSTCSGDAKEGKRGRPWRAWTLAGATVVVVTLLVVA